jgi:hypothetical protein
MGTDMIAVLGLALLFFFGIIYFIVKERNQSKAHAESFPVWSNDSNGQNKREKTR